MTIRWLVSARQTLAGRRGALNRFGFSCRRILTVMALWLLPVVARRMVEAPGNGVHAFWPVWTAYGHQDFPPAGDEVERKVTLHRPAVCHGGGDAAFLHSWWCCVDPVQSELFCVFRADPNRRFGRRFSRSRRVSRTSVRSGRLAPEPAVKMADGTWPPLRPLSVESSSHSLKRRDWFVRSDVPVSVPAVLPAVFPPVAGPSGSDGSGLELLLRLLLSVVELLPSTMESHGK